MRGVLGEGDPFVRDVEEDDRRPQNPFVTEHVDVEDIGDADQNEDQDLAADPFEADGTRQLPVRDGAQHTGDVVADHEDDERDQKPVTASEEVSEPSADSGKDELND